MATDVRNSARAMPPALETEDEGWDNDNPLWVYLNKLGTAPAWVASLLIHVLVLMILSTFVYYPPSELFNMAINSEIIDLDEQPIVVDAAQVDNVGSNSDTNLGGMSSSMAEARGDNPETKVQEQIEEKINPIEINVLEDEIEVPPQDDLVAKVNSKGAASTETTGGTEGAIDRLTFELMASLRERKTLVVWLFDASLSLKSRRDLIADRFENVYSQLEALDGAASKHLKTAVATFGKDYNLLTPEPLDDIKKVVPMVRAIKNDESGKELVFASVTALAKKFVPYARNSSRKMLLIIVTDEKGDDAPQYLEESIMLLRRSGTKCFVVGNGAPFGREKGTVTWNYPPPDSGSEEIEVDQGPESIEPEALRLGFFGVNGGDLDRMSSGYGPYALTRLCAETGGVYLMAEQGSGPKFDPYGMRNYSPEYMPIKDYYAMLSKNKAKGNLVMVAKKTAVEGIPIPQTYFAANNDNELREQITEAQKPLAVLDYKLTEMNALLEAGEKDREKMTEGRWQAAYDLAHGRVLAMRARAAGYNNMLAEMKLNPKPFEKKGNNQWQIAPAKEVDTIPAVKKMASKASTLLKRVIDDHPDTPWAMLAERELSVPMGWEWKEGMDRNARMANMSAEEKKKIEVLFAEEEKKQQKRRMMEAARKKPNL